MNLFSLKSKILTRLGTKLPDVTRTFTELVEFNAVTSSPLLTDVSLASASRQHFNIFLPEGKNKEIKQCMD